MSKKKPHKKKFWIQSNKQPRGFFIMAKSYTDAINMAVILYGGTTNNYKAYKA